MTYTNAKLAVDGINYLLPHSRLGWAWDSTARRHRKQRLNECSQAEPSPCLRTHFVPNPSNGRAGNEGENGRQRLLIC